MSSKPIRSEDVKLPKSLRGLPRIDFTTAPATTPEQGSQEDMLYGVRSLSEAVERGARRIARAAVGKSGGR